ncbi:2-oxoglutarate and iron-dependent oxygenase domain-containing protein [Roseiarcaceae bacterium H3SJ34-1]|uniref:isopenicillin N synthase family dioxygenase n=1 Tax=Terripilifer ovatus TaxID=3032367 RepID=UPI003AB97E50|nr:2-oxoglutarate and iron-dependent oxygenase domain-containing protein [Roseiarcaceae bacterium H3SJ34-1]
MTMENVPVIDLSPSFSGGEEGRQKVAEAIRAACEDIGFFTVVGHGVADATIEALRRNAREYFALPLAEKEKVPQPVERISRGYSHVCSRGLAYSTGKETPPDLQESFAMGPIDEAPDDVRGALAERYFFRRNTWPHTPAGFAAAAEAYYREMERLSLHILQLFARALGLDDHYFDDKLDHHTSTMRTIYYPPQSEAPQAGQLRAGEHTDYGTLTILTGDDVPGGLQVKLRNGGWVDVHPLPNAFICNIGDLMMRWTNDKWVSNPHRVANPPAEYAHIGRLSIPFFHNPNANAEIRCIRAFYGEAEAEKYPPVKFGEFYLSKHLKAQNMTVETA